VKKDKHISNLKNIKEIIPLMKVNDELIYDIKNLKNFIMQQFVDFKYRIW
jgi:hypothetical protein